MNHTPNTEQRERAEFEAWLGKPMMNPAQPSHYNGRDVRLAWEAWQAARATQAAPASPEPDEFTDAMYFAWDGFDNSMSCEERAAIYFAVRAVDPSRAPASPEPASQPVIEWYETMRRSMMIQIDNLINVAVRGTWGSDDAEECRLINGAIDHACKAVEGYRYNGDGSAQRAKIPDRAPASPNTGAVPDGWKMVPIEPTEDMVIDGFESRPEWGFTPYAEMEKYEAMSGCKQAAHRARLCYAAMLAAAPTAPAPGDCVVVPRTVLQKIDDAMQHMGDQLNEMDAVEEEDEAIVTPAFEAITALLATPSPSKGGEADSATDGEVRK